MTIITRFSLFVLTFFSTLLFIPNSTSLTAQELFNADIENLVEEYVNKSANKGLVVVLLQENQSDIKGFGYISRKNKQIPNEQTLFEIGAITNVFTTSLMMLEAQDGKFQLEDRIQEYLPEGIKLHPYQEIICEPETPQISIDHDGRSIFDRVCQPAPFAPLDHVTFCDLATHTSGLPNAPHGLYSWNPFRLAKQLKDPFEDYSKDELYSKLNTYLLGYAPGTYFSYSNLGVGLLGNVVADISGKTYEEELIERILQPLAMNNTVLEVLPEQQEYLAQGHNRRGKPVDHWHFEALAPAGGLRSNGADMLLFLEANLNSDSNEFTTAFEQAHQPRVDTKPLYGRSSSIGYGWMTSGLSSTVNLPVTWLNGATAGFSSFIGFTKDTGVGVVILSNTDRSVDEMGFEMLEVLNNTLPATSSDTDF